MKFLYALLTIGICFLSLSGCRTKAKQQESLISVTIEPQRFFVEKIAGDDFQVNCVIPAGQSPETYDPTPQQMMQISRSRAYFKIGYIGFELAWMKTLEEQNPRMQVFDLSQGMNLIQNSGEEAHHHGLIDPHVWTSPEGAKVMARNILEALSSLNPAHRSLYEQNYRQVLQEIEQTEGEMRRLLDPLKGTSFIIYHPALTYLARDFGMQQLCLELDGKEPSPTQLQQLIEKARLSQAKVVFVQQEFDQKNAELIAQETGCRLVQINPLRYDWHQEMLRLATLLSEPDHE